MSRKSGGRESTKVETSASLLMSSFRGRTWTPEPTSFLMSSASCFRLSIRRAVRMSLRFLGDVRANSMAVLFPMPLEAPVTTIVLPSSRLPIAVAIVRGWWKGELFGG